MDNFLKWFILGMALLFFIYLMSGIKTSSSSLYPNQKNLTPPPATLEYNQNGGYVGRRNIIASKTFWIKYFNTSKDIDTQIFSYYDTRVYNGLLFGKKYIVMVAHPDLKDYVSSSLQFTISDTNRYGALKIMLNNFILGEKVYDVGSYTIPVKKEWLSNETKIIFYPESSLWRLWAPTVYNLSGPSLMIKRYYERPFIFKFNLTNNENNVQSSSLKLNVISEKGTLKIYCNKDLIYNGAPKDNNIEINVPVKCFHPGENYIKFESGNNGEYQGSALLDIDYKTAETSQLEKDVYFDGSDYDYLRYENGKVSFQIVRTYSRGGFELEIINSNGEVTLQKFGEADPGYYEYDITQGMISIGNNRFVIKPIDGASFDVYGFRVEK